MFKNGDKVQLVGFPITDPKYQSIGTISFQLQKNGKQVYYVTVKNYIPMEIDAVNLLLIDQ